MPPKKQNRPNGAVMKPGNSTKSSPVNPAPVSKSNKRKSDESNATVNGVNGKRHKGTPDQQNGLPVNRKDWAYDELLRAAVEPLSTKDIDEWDGWVELESDPAFLSSMLADCGVRNVKVEELISMEDDNLVVLSQPFFGLIFLHECQAESDEEAAEDDEDSDDVWFANQTIENACATIALMNIIMNCPQVDLGPELQKFKDDTDELCSPLKGQALGSNSFIRKNHNSLARRIDVFNSDLNLQASLRKFTASKTRESPKKKKKKAASVEEPEPGTQGYHYVAYVEVNGWIWRLDGLKAPVKLGRVPDGENLISAARPYIQAHIAAFNDSVYFSLMVLSESPLSRTIAQLGQTVAHFDELSTRAGSDPQLAALLQASEQPRVRLGLGLRQYGLTPDILSNVQIDGDFHQKVTDPEADLNELYQLYMDLINEQKMLLGSHRDETGILNASRRTYDSRKHDALAMINRWVEAIAAHGKLEKFASGTLDATDVAGEQAAADVAAEVNEAEEAEEEVEVEEAEEAIEANGANGADEEDDDTTLIDSDDPDA